MVFYEYEGNYITYIQAVRDSICLFLSSVALSMVACVVISGLAMHFIHQSQTTTSVAVVAAIAESGNPVLHFGALFINNLVFCVLMLIIPYAIQKSWGKYLIYGAIMSFGVLIGSVILIVTGQHNIMFMLSSLIPHGIFELSAFFLCTGYGLMVFRSPTYPVFKPAWDIWNMSIKGLLIYYVMPLTLIAAIVETYITPILMSMAA